MKPCKKKMKFINAGQAQAKLDLFIKRGGWTNGRTYFCEEHNCFHISGMPVNTLRERQFAVQKDQLKDINAGLRRSNIQLKQTIAELKRELKKEKFNSEGIVAVEIKRDERLKELSRRNTKLQRDNADLVARILELERKLTNLISNP